MLHAPEQGFSNCGTRATNGAPNTFQWYKGLVRKKRRLKKFKFFFNGGIYMEHLI
jgi:hypothetical protein